MIFTLEHTILQEILAIDLKWMGMGLIGSSLIQCPSNTVACFSSHCQLRFPQGDWTRESSFEERVKDVLFVGQLFLLHLFIIFLIIFSLDMDVNGIGPTADGVY